MTHRQLPVTFRLEKSGVISPKNPWKYYIQGGYSSCGHMFWVISSQCPLGGGHLSCWRSSGCERHWGATIIEELEGLGTISMLFFLPLLTFSFFFNKRKGSLCRWIPGDPLGIQAAGACRGPAEEGPSWAALRPGGSRALGIPKVGRFLREFPRPPGVIHLKLYNYIKL